MSLSSMEAALYAWLKIEVGSGVTVIMAGQSEARPARPYISLDFVNPSSRLGGIDETRVSGQTIKNVAQRRTMASINAYGSNAVDILSQIRDSLDRLDTVERFKAAGIAHVGESDVRDLTELLVNNYETRAQFDLFIYYARDISTEGISTIEHVTIETEEDGEIIVNPIEED